MILTKDKRADFQRAAQPLMKWLANNCHPHCQAFVDSCNAELVEGLCSVAIDSAMAAVSAMAAASGKGGGE